MADEAVFRWVVAIGVILAAVAFLVQAGIAIALYRIATPMQAKVMPLADRAEPILDTTRQILEENRPRIAEISTRSVEIARSTREQVVKVGLLLDDASGRARERLAEIDQKVGDTVERVEHVGSAVKTAVLKPVQEANAIMAGIRAALVTYARGGRRPSVDHATQDEEMFI